MLQTAGSSNVLIEHTALGNTVYEPLRVDTVSLRLGGVAQIADRIGDPGGWQVMEVGDGNLNLVFIVTGERGRIVVKQALPYVRAAGESWPLSLNRAYFEQHALTRLGQRAPDRLPQLYLFDPAQALQVIEHLYPHVILRKQLIAGKFLPGLALQLGTYLARSLFRGSDLCMPTAQLKADVALFLGNSELTGITEDLFFTDPFCECSRNRHTPGLDADAAVVRRDRELKIAALELKCRFSTVRQTLLHGDLHTGSVMVCDADTKIIDAEFASYGPMGFDLGSLLGNLWLAYFAQVAHRGSVEDCAAYCSWILQVVAEIWGVFAAEFSQLWRTERNGILGGKDLFELQDDPGGAEIVLQSTLQAIWKDTLGYAGLEMHRRILGFAHVADFESIADDAMRAACARKALAAGRQLTVYRRSLKTVAQANALVAGQGLAC
jgi:5-methylthioribose kinase